MVIFLILLLIVSIYKIKLSTFNEDYMSRESTASVKGIFIMLVFLSHIRAYMTLPDGNVFSEIMNSIGQLMVAMFLFYSGYGVLESYKSKPNYADGFLKNRFFKTLLHFDIAVLLFLIISIIFGDSYPERNYLLCWIGWESIGNSNWFVFVILALYLLTWLCFKVSDKEYILRFCVLQTVVTVGLIALLKLAGKDQWWYDTALCYSAGIWFSCFKDRLDTALQKKQVYYPALAVLTAVFFVLYNMEGAARYCLCTTVFSLIVVMLTVKLSIGNKALAWLGNHLFEIYILQRIPMIILSRAGLENPVGLTFAALALTIGLAAVFNTALKSLDRKLFCKR